MFRPARPLFVTFALSTIVGVTACIGQSTPDAAHSPTISEVRAELLEYVSDVPNATGYRYSATDDQGRPIGPIKIIQVAETGEYAGVYHWGSVESGFHVALGTSTNLLDWTWRRDLASFASQPTITAASDGGYVVAWESDLDPHVRLNYFPTWQDLLAGRASKEFDAQRQLSDCAEGTPNLYSANSTEVDFGFHFFAGCEVDRQARATSDWSTWEALEQPLLDRAVLFQGYRGSVGDRDVITFRGYEYTFLEGQFTPGDWGSFRVLLYDEETGLADRISFPAAPPAPPSVHVFIHTHQGSYSFSNMTVSQVEFGGQQALVVSLFIHRGPEKETGELIFYRLLPERD